MFYLKSQRDDIKQRWAKPIEKRIQMDKKYKGVVIPTITPLTASLDLDEEAVEKMFANFYLHNCEPFILGTTGEAASIPTDVKKAFIKKAAELKKAGTHLYVGISSNCFTESIEMAEYSADNGADVVVATLPSYYSLTDSQIKTYFIQLANESPLPVIIYNIPATTHVSLPLDIIDALSRHPNIVGAKDSERSDERLKTSIGLWKNRTDFSHFVGWAAKSAQALIDGTDGIIPSTGNLHPKLYQDLINAVKESDTEKAYAYQKQSNELGNLYQGGRTLGESLWALKILMQEKDLCQPFVMPPLQAMSSEEINKLITGLKEFRI